ncbi:MAG: helix-turn-helix domain-containing protein [Rectinema sp.]
MSEIEEMLPSQEAAKLLGITPKTLWSWIKQGKIRAAKPGKGYRIPKSELSRCLNTEEIK